MSTKRDNIPTAWYDLSSRVSNAKVVVDMALDYSFCTLTPSKEQAEQNAKLVSAIQDLLTLCEHDVLQLEQQLLQLNSSS